MKTIKRVLHDYLMGAAHIFDFTGMLAPRLPPIKILTDEEAAQANWDALCGDWRAIAGDMGMAHVHLLDMYPELRKVHDEYMRQHPENTSS